MMTINKNTKLTDGETVYLVDLFSSGIKVCRKVKLFGAGHPELPDLFGIDMDEEAEAEFWEDHETTHARFIIYASLGDMMADTNLCRHHLTYNGMELKTMPIYKE